MVVIWTNINNFYIKSVQQDRIKYSSYLKKRKTDNTIVLRTIYSSLAPKLASVVVFVGPVLLVYSPPPHPQEKRKNR
jgi:hypothetical protein